VAVSAIGVLTPDGASSGFGGAWPGEPALLPSAAQCASQWLREGGRCRWRQV